MDCFLVRFATLPSLRLIHLVLTDALAFLLQDILDAPFFKLQKMRCM
jgi:hypothetical protein